jgi:hypothetical protein
MDRNVKNLGLIFRIWVCLLILVWGWACQERGSAPSAEKVFVNGHIITMDEDLSEAEAFAVGQEKFLAVGTNDEVMAAYPGSEVIDLKGKTVMPGIIESHGHLLSLGQSFLELNVEGVQTPQEVVKRVQERVGETSPGEWIIGWGWDEGAWAKEYPSNRELSSVSPENPVYLRGLHGFASWVNDKALEMAGITEDTPDPAQGKILKEPTTGRLIGILTNEAQSLVTSHISPMSLQQTEKALELALDECLKHGLTTIHEAKASARMLEAFRLMKQRDKLKCRIYVMLDVTDEALIEPFLQTGPEVDPDQLLAIRCLKVFVDGALGSRGAALLEPYSDAPEERGVIVTSEEELRTLTERSLKSGLQVAIHAIGDRGNRLTLDVFDRALRKVPGTEDHRLRVEHAQVVALEDIPRFAALDLVLSMQPPHCTSDMPWAEIRVGAERIKGAYAWRSFLDTGVHLTLNSDFPGETLNPFYGMYAALTRQNPEGEPEGGWYADQCLERFDVLKGYTVEAAYSGFEEDIKGRIIPGMLADFILLSDDILSIPPLEFLSLKVEQTYVGGQLVFKSGQPDEED